MEKSIRQFNDKDAIGVKELILGILTKEYPFDKTAYSDTDLYKIQETYGGPKEIFYVVEENGEIVGSVGIKRDGPEDALLRRLFVDVKHRGRGYGNKLVEKAINFCKKEGYKKVFFRCTGRMANAMKLCMKHGFKEVEKLEIGGFNIHMLRLDLRD